MSNDIKTDIKTAIVTGAGSGIGRASALALVEARFHVFLAGRRLDALEETARRTKADMCTTMATDVADDRRAASIIRTTARPSSPPSWEGVP